jgi:diguanylate cyclase (GGDEF)-like protein
MHPEVDPGGLMGNQGDQSRTDAPAARRGAAVGAPPGAAREVLSQDPQPDVAAASSTSVASTTDQLSEILREFARTMVTDFPIQAILERLVERIADVLPVDSAGVTLISSGKPPEYIAASSPAALRFESLQSKIGQGPCLEAFSTGEAIAVPDLRAETQFPKFAAQALEAGLRAVYAFPLRHGDESLGALDLYLPHPGSLQPAAMAAAQTLADVASAYILNARQRAALVESAEKAQAMTRCDELTGLANRTALRETLAHALRRARRSGKTVAVIFTDLDRFKEINDRHGHQAGDELLVAIAKRLSALVRPNDTLARLSGDEFVVVCDDLADEAAARTIAQRITAAVAVPVVLSHAVVTTTVSVGIALADHDDPSPEKLLYLADMAMYEAKRTGGDDHRVVAAAERHPASPRPAAPGASLRRLGA